MCRRNTVARFWDASFTGYGVCVYFRVQYSNRSVQCAVFAHSKVDLVDMWFNGSLFLKYDERDWPEQPDLPRVSDDDKEDSELKKDEIVILCSIS